MGVFLVCERLTLLLMLIAWLSDQTCNNVCMSYCAFRYPSSQTEARRGAAWAVRGRVLTALAHCLSFADKSRVWLTRTQLRPLSSSRDFAPGSPARTRAACGCVDVFQSSMRMVRSCWLGAGAVDAGQGMARPGQDREIALSGRQTLAPVGKPDEID